jgi:hypothetical protein
MDIPSTTRRIFGFFPTVLLALGWILSVGGIGVLAQDKNGELRESRPVEAVLLTEDQGKDEAVVTSDFDGDRKPDTAVGTLEPNGYEIEVRLSSHPASPVFLRGDQTGPVAILVGDFGHNHHPDIAVAETSALSEPDIWIGNGSGEFRFLEIAHSGFGPRLPEGTLSGFRGSVPGICQTSQIDPFHENATCRPRICKLLNLGGLTSYSAPETLERAFSPTSPRSPPAHSSRT